VFWSQTDVNPPHPLIAALTATIEAVTHSPVRYAVSPDYTKSMLEYDTAITENIVHLLLNERDGDASQCAGVPRRMADLYLCGLRGGLDPAADYATFKQLGGVSHAVYLMVYNRAVVDFLNLT
jgi:hypothetical protein